MRAHTWKVEARVPGGRFGWICTIDRLSRTAAGYTADHLARKNPEWKLRLVDELTGEIVHVEKASAA